MEGWRQGNSRDFILVAQFGCVFTPRSLWSGTPVMEYKGRLGFMSWTKWLQVKLHGITDLYKSVPRGWTPTSLLLTGKQKNIILPFYFDLSFSDTAFPPSLASLVTPRALWHLQSLKTSELFSFKFHLTIIQIKFRFARHNVTPLCTKSSVDGSCPQWHTSCRGPAHPTELGHLISLDHPTIYSWDLLEGIEKFFQFLPNNKLV